VKKKNSVTPKDRKDWTNFTKNLGSLYDKEKYFVGNDLKKNKIKKIDLHGLTLDNANQVVKKFIIDFSEEGFKKFLIITGKGLRSKNIVNPYISETMSVLKNSVPDFIKRDEELSLKVKKITKAEQKDGGEGAIYVLLK
tara:strand:- start:123 stop:539 length:417 start_codon:yes stop_codon:yes gene_type:complete